VAAARGLTGTPSACPITTIVPANRSGITRSRTGTVGETFDMLAQWQGTPSTLRGQASYCAAECGEYRQFVRGHALSSANADGSGLQDASATLFGGFHLEENTFHEDGRNDNSAARYGHRDEPRTMNEAYKPDRSGGAVYEGHDFPNISIGTFADLDLHFLGKTTDVCNGTDTTSDQWAVQYRGVIRP
jgi:hypothetical protein